MINFADRLCKLILYRGNPCSVGLDPRAESIPRFAFTRANQGDPLASAATAIVSFHELILDSIADQIPAVKLQIACYEQYGLPGLSAFQETIRMARNRGLIVIVDAKRGDIASTASAYTNAFLGRTPTPEGEVPIFDVDALTVSPLLGEDSLIPFVQGCRSYGKGIFVLVKTSNPGSRDFQDLVLRDTGRPLFEKLAQLTSRLGEACIGEYGYSSIGAVVGGTFPSEAQFLRSIMPQTLFLVPGYGTQGGNPADIKKLLDADGLGAIVNASRSITYAHTDNSITRQDYIELLGRQLASMIDILT